MKHWFIKPYSDFVDMLCWFIPVSVLCRGLFWYFNGFPGYPVFIVEVIIQTLVILTLHFIVRAAVLLYLLVSGLLIKS